MTPEGKVKAQVKKLLDPRVRAGHVYYFMPVGGPFSRKGVPDFVGHANVDIAGHTFSVPFYIETKADGEPTTLQKIEHEKIRAAGGRVFVLIGKRPALGQYAEDWDRFTDFLRSVVD